MVKKITAALLAILTASAFFSCGKKESGQTDNSADIPKKEIRKIIDYGEHLRDLETIDKSCPSFVKEGSIEQTLIYDDNGIAITAESIEYTDDHAELKLTVENTNEHTIVFEKTDYVLNYIQNTDIGLLAVDPQSTDTWIYNIDYFPMERFGVECIDTIQFGFRLYEYDGNKDDISDDILSATFLSDKKAIFPEGVKDELELLKSVFTTEVIHTSSYRSLTEQLADSPDDFSEDDLSYIPDEYKDIYYPDDPLLASYTSGYIDTYFLQNTQDITSCTFNDNEDYEVTSASFGEIDNKEDPGNKWFQYAFFNNTDKVVNVETTNVIINGLSVATKTSSLTGIHFLPGTINLVHDLQFPVYFNKAHWNIYGIDDIKSISFDYIVTPQGESSGSKHHADIYFKDETDPVNTSGETVYKNNDVSVISKGLYENAAYYQGDYTAALLIENTSNDDVYISARLEKPYGDDISFVKVNGESASAYIKTKDDPLKVPSGGYGAYFIYLDAPSLNKRNINSLSDIDVISLSLDIRDSQQRLTDHADIEINN